MPAGGELPGDEGVRRLADADHSVAVGPQEHGMILTVIPARAITLLAVPLLVAGCGGSSEEADTRAAAPPQPASVCPKLWAETPKSQSQCATLLRRLKVARARHVFAPPKRG